MPGAWLYCERRGTGPPLPLIGSPMDSTGFAGLVSALAGRYTVVTYDPRSIGTSSRQDTTSDVTPEQQADDVRRLLAVLGGEPADVSGSSGGAVVGLALVTAHPGQVRTLVAHEPPVVKLLPGRAQVRAQIQDIYDTCRVGRAKEAMQKFMTHAGLGNPAAQDEGAPRWEPSPEQMAQMRAATGDRRADIAYPERLDSHGVAGRLRRTPSRDRIQRPNGCALQPHRDSLGDEIDGHRRATRQEGSIPDGRAAGHRLGWARSHGKK